MKQVEKYIQELEEYDSNAAEVLKQYSASFDSEQSYERFVSLVHKCFREAKEIGEFIEQISYLMIDTDKASFYKDQYDKYLDDAKEDLMLLRLRTASVNDIANELYSWSDLPEVLRIAQRGAVTRIVLEIIKERMHTLRKNDKAGASKGGRKEDSKDFKDYVVKGMDAENVRKCLHDIIDNLNDEKQAMCVIVAACRVGALVDHPSSTMIRSEFPVIKGQKTISNYLANLPTKWADKCSEYEDSLKSALK